MSSLSKPALFGKVWRWLLNAAMRLTLTLIVIAVLFVAEAIVLKTLVEPGLSVAEAFIGSPSPAMLAVAITVIVLIRLKGTFH